ncbi:oxidoreductase, 2OG-Fe(II) oxygenase family [Cystobacter fuscus DSM 2262]|uniref:Oxidoreductase, 2OG-Fe(II) oxygenase family n=1 Tax=Cystobacter fuscus (strain ATCC 25194 / DSM 2262 / NBRC 100088 / M29) TaxID=1242864 RepID=S9QID3_CYSF2|nr:2OG-Fe(II) oxygenase [Cystobacter fuscus]EPX61034.1 oxidoreductase, 2OG-Fe(II) oxygenase family [Cystobacter fuscus DSM 2262]
MHPLSLRDEEVQALGEHGWFTREGFLGESEARALLVEARACVEAGRLRPAGIRRGADLTLDRSTRGDFITWVEPGEADTAFGRLRDTYTALGEALSAGAYLGLGRFDLQLAWYPGGGERYARHADAFPGQSNRRVTAIYYLNPEWTPEHGGLLRLYPEGGPVDVEPRLDRLVVFLSERIEHEVLPARAPRLALTAWFYGRDAG